MEEIVGGIIHLIARIIGWFFIEVFLQVFCWGIGWVSLKLFTFGHYPKKDTKEDTVSFVGFIMILLSIAGLTFYFHFGSN